MLLVYLFFIFLDAFLVISLPSHSKANYAKNQNKASAEYGVGEDEALFLTPYIEKGQIKEGQKLATVPPMLHQQSFSGFLTVNKTTDSNMFFWLFKSQQGKWEDRPLVVWLQGGPGASFVFGLFQEIGPFYVTKNNKLKRRKYSWNRKYNLLFFDNPVGTGFSFTKTDTGYARNETHVAADLYEALVQVYKLFPALQKNELFITGQSYAGKYIPAIAHKIYHTNKYSTFKINLAGLMIGNGVTDPLNSLDYASYPYYLGLIDAKLRDELKKAEDEQRAEIRAGKFLLALQDRIKEVIKLRKNAGLKMSFDFVHDSMGEDHGEVDFINSTKTRRAIHVGNYAFDDFGETVYDHLEEDIMQSVKPWVEELLTAEKFPILYYSGQLDLRVSYFGNLGFYNALNWPRASEYHTAKRCIFQVDTETAGYFKTAGTFTEVLVRNTGHMVPISQPKWAFELLDRFITNVTLFKCY